MATSVGDVVVGLRLDSGGFDAGTASALRSAQRLGQIVDQFGRPMGAVARITDDAGAAITRTGNAAHAASGHFSNSSAQMARFAAIGVQQLVPSLDGSRVALEGAIQGVTRLTGGFGLLALAGAGVAGAIGGALYFSFRNTEQGTRDTVKGVMGLDDTIGKLEKQIDENIDTLGTWRAALKPLSGAETAFNLFPEDSANLARAQIDAISARIGRLRDQIEKLKGAKLLEDPAAGPAGSIARGLAGQAGQGLETLDKDIQKFLATSRIALVEDPLGKMLIQDWQRTQDAINAIRELTFLTEKERNQRIGVVGAEGGMRQINLRDQSALAKWAGAVPADPATQFGIGAAGLIGGVTELRRLRSQIDEFKDSMVALVREAGIPARDVFPQIAEGQDQLNNSIAALKDKYRDVPAILNRIVDLEREFGNNDLQRSIDDSVRALGGLTQGGYESVVMFRETKVVMDESATAFDAVDISAITLTGNVYALGQAFSYARTQAILMNAAVAGVGQVAVPAPGNF